MSSPVALPSAAPPAPQPPTFRPPSALYPSRSSPTLPALAEYPGDGPALVRPLTVILSHSVRQDLFHLPAAAAVDQVDVLDTADPFGGLWHHDSRYDACLVVPRRPDPRQHPSRSRRSSMATIGTHGPSPLSKSTTPYASSPLSSQLSLTSSSPARRRISLDEADPADTIRGQMSPMDEADDKGKRPMYYDDTPLLLEKAGVHPVLYDDDADKERLMRDILESRRERKIQAMMDKQAEKEKEGRKKMKWWLFGFGGKGNREDGTLLVVASPSTPSVPSPPTLHSVPKSQSKSSISLRSARQPAPQSFPSSSPATTEEQPTPKRRFTLSLSTSSRKLGKKHKKDSKGVGESVMPQEPAPLEDAELGLVPPRAPFQVEGLPDRSPPSSQWTPRPTPTDPTMVPLPHSLPNSPDPNSPLPDVPPLQDQELEGSSSDGSSEAVRTPASEGSPLLAVRSLSEGKTIADT